MGRAHYADSLLAPPTGSTTPQLLASAVVNVYQPGTTTPVTPLYAGETGPTTLPNPITTGSDGRVEFWLAARAWVDLHVSKPGYTAVTRRVEVRGDPAEDVTTGDDQTIPAAKVLEAATLTDPTIEGGTIDGADLLNVTFTSPTWTTPSMTSPTVTSGQSKVQKGSQSAPAVAPHDDLNSGLFFPADDQVGLSAGNASVFQTSGSGATSSTFVNTKDGKSMEFSSPRGLKLGLRQWDLRHEGLIPTLSDDATMTSNKNVLEALWAKAADLEAGGEIVVDGNLYFFPSGVALNHGKAFGVPLSLRGVPGRTEFRMGPAIGTQTPGSPETGTHVGPWFNVGTVTNSQVAKGAFRDLIFTHAGQPTSGATFRAGKVIDLLLERCFFHNRAIGGGSFGTYGAFNPVEIVSDAAASALPSGVRLIGCELHTMTEQGGTDAFLTGKRPISLRVNMAASSQVGAGLWVDQCDLSGCTRVSTGILFDGVGDWDTAKILNGTSVKDHKRGLEYDATGYVSNVMFSDMDFDGISETCVYLVPPAGGSGLDNWSFDHCWYASLNRNFLVYLDNRALNGLVIQNSNVMTSATTLGVYVHATSSGSVGDLMIQNNRIRSQITGGSGVGIDVTAGAAGNIHGQIVNNYVAILAGGLVPINVGANVDPIMVAGNVGRGGSSGACVAFGGSTSASRVNGTNAWKA